MIRKKILIGILLLFAVFMIAGCGDSADSDKSSHEFAGFQTEKVDASLTDSVGAMISGDELDFSALTYSSFDGTIEVGDYSEVEGVIPESGYTLDDVEVWTDTEDLVSIKDAEITEQGGDSVLTFDVVGEKTGTETIYLQLKSSEYYHYFDLEIVDASDAEDSTYDAGSFEVDESLDDSDSLDRAAPSADDRTVYRTRTGEKYHAYGCRYLKDSCIEISIGAAQAMGLEPCSVCKPGY